MKTKEQIEAEKMSNKIATLIQSNRVLVEIIQILEKTPVPNDLKDKKQKVMKDFIERFLELNEVIYKNMFGEAKIKIH